MSLVNLSAVATRCKREGSGLGAFNVVHLESAEAFVAAASAAARPGSKLPFERNRSVTAEVVGLCHAADVSVEAELGEVGGKNGVHDPSARTDPDEAKRFVDSTGVDLLAVAVGSSHAMTTREAVLDTGLIAELAAAVDVPLVLHGSSGVDDASMRAAIAAGITKVNVSTHLNVLYTAAVREYLAEHPDVVDTRKQVKPGYDAVRAEVERLLRLYAQSAPLTASPSGL